MTRAKYPIYKGLGKPLEYKGFKGKFIYWGVGSLGCGLVLGGLVGALTNMYLGAILTVVSICAGLAYTFYRQKGGLHDKTRHTGVFIHPVNLKINHEKSAKEPV